MGVGTKIYRGLQKATKKPALAQLISLSVCCWWRSNNTFPRQDICCDPRTAVLVCSVGSGSDEKKAMRKPEKHRCIPY